MIEPTETESKETLDAFADALLRDQATRTPSSCTTRRTRWRISRPDEVQGGQGAGPALEAGAEPARVRLLPYAVADGPTNMAADEVLLEAAAAGVASLRFYGWSDADAQPRLFPADAVRRADPAWPALPWVRRPTGGETLVHHHELTYALALPAGLPWQTRNSRGGAACTPSRGRARGARVSRSRFARTSRRRRRRAVLSAPHAGRPAAGRRQGRRHRPTQAPRALLQHGSILSTVSPLRRPSSASTNWRIDTSPPQRSSRRLWSSFRATGWELMPTDWTAEERRQVAARGRIPLSLPGLE